VRRFDARAVPVGVASGLSSILQRLCWGFLLIIVALDVHAATPRSESHALDRLKALQRRIGTLECTVDLTMEDSRSPSGAKVSKVRRTLRYSKAAARVRFEVVSGDSSNRKGVSPRSLDRAQRAPPGPAVRITKASGSEPQWLFGLAAGVPGSEVRVAGQGNGRVVEYRASEPKPSLLLRRVVLNAEGLPEKVVTFGLRERVLDEVTVSWQIVGGVAFPRETVLVQHSRLNTVTTTVRYSGVRINQPLAATLFDGP
jgi:hypothetical protein